MTKVKTVLIKTYEALAEYFETCESLVVFDSEDMGLSIESPIIGFSFWDFKNNPVFAITNSYFKEGMPLADLVRCCNKYFPLFTAIGHNIKFDLGITKYNGIIDIPLECDTSSMVHLYNPDLKKKLETRVKDDLGYDKKTYNECMGENAGKKTAIKWPETNKQWFEYLDNGWITLNSMSEYAGEDAYWTGKLYEHYLPLLTKDDWKIMKDIEIPLIYTLRDMHNRGINVNLPYFEKLDKELDKALTLTQQNIYKEAGAVFNLKSPKQVGEILFDKMGLPSYSKTATGNRSADSSVMKQLASEGYKIGEYMVEYSSIKMLSQTFVKPIPSMVSNDNRLRCSFNIDIARSGRLTSNGPNLQNQPNNKKFPVRKAYLPTDGWKLIDADLSQIELRMMAHVSGDKAFHKAFYSGVDIHQFVADDLGVERDQAKTLNFAIIYGMGPKNLALALGVTQNEAKKIISDYQNTYSGYYQWKEENERFIRKNACVYNIFGRVRRLPAARNSDTLWQAYLAGNNTVIQGSAGELIKIIMNNVDREYKRRNMRSGLLLTVHDELLVDSPPNEVEEAHNILIDKMENSVKLSVPILAEGKVINTWDNMKDKTFISLLPQYQKQNFPLYILNK